MFVRKVPISRFIYRYPSILRTSTSHLSTFTKGNSFKVQINDSELIEFMETYVASKQKSGSSLSPDELRQEMVNTALKVGMLSLKHAHSHSDSHMVRNEVDRMLEQLKNQLEQHHFVVNNMVTSKLAEYFDPKSGRFEDRINRLLNNDGELSTVIRAQLADAPLFKLLDINNQHALPHTLEKMVSQQIEKQNALLFDEFSLDNKDSSLSRLVVELRRATVDNSATTDSAVQKLMSQFSLDNPSGILNKLILNIQQSNRVLQDEFSPTNDHGALNLLKKELFQMIKTQNEHISEFQTNMLKEINSLHTERQIQQTAPDRHTTFHGAEYEEQVFEEVKRLLRGNDSMILEQCGNRTGIVRNCKVGDLTITMGEEHVAAGSSIVVECKAAKNYTLNKVLEELELGLKNRQADVGIFVYHPQHLSHTDIEQFTRIGNNIIVAYDPEDRNNVLYLECAVSLARALLVRKTHSSSRGGLDEKEHRKVFDLLEKALRDIENEVGSLNDMKKMIESVMSNGEKMLNRIRISGGRITNALSVIEEAAMQLKK